MEKPLSQDALVQIINSVGEPIFVKDRQHRMVLVNDAFCLFHKRTREELLGKTMADYLPPCQSQGMWANNEQVFRTGQENVSEETVTDADGVDHVIVTKKTRYQDASGDQLLVGVFRDVSEQKMMEQRLAEALAFQRTLFDVAPVGIVCCNSSGEVVSVNDAAARIAGGAVDAMVKRKLHEMESVVKSGILAAAQEVLATGQEVRREFYITSSFGKTSWLSGRIAPFTHEGERFLLLLANDITEQKKAEAALRESDQRYHSLFANMKQGVVYCRILFQDGRACDWIYLEANQAFTEMVGIKDIVGMKISERFPNFRETDSDILEHYGRVAMTGQAERFETYMHASRVWYAISVYSPQPEHIVAVLDVITERKRTEEALRESEHHYRSLFTNLMQGLIYCRVLFNEGKAYDWIYLEANEAFCAYTGLQNVIGRKISELVPGFIEAEPELVARYGRVASTGQAERFEIYINSTKIWSSICVYSPRPWHFVSVMEPVTERKLAEEQLRKLSRAVEQSPVSIIITDLRGKIEYVNPKFTEVTGYTTADVLGSTPRLLKSGVNDARLYQDLWGAILAGNEWHGEICNRKKNGELFWESLAISPITDSQGKVSHFLALKEDITAHKQLENQFRQAQKMEAFGRLAAGVAHDFNNMLTSILGNAEMLATGDPLDANQREFLTEVIKAAERAASLTRQLLMFSRRQAVQLKVVELNEVVENMGKMLRRLIGEDISLKTEHGRGKMPVLADPGMLEQVLMNFAVNSRDAMPKGGDLVIQTAMVEIMNPSPRQRAGWFVRLSVSDTGCGIAPKDLEHIFEPFFTTKEIGKGTGLGLATVFGIVEQHKGWLEVESQVGVGTKFSLFLPRHMVVAEANAGPQTKPHERGGTETILLVEDDESVRALARGLLVRHGYRVIEAVSGPAALGVWKQQKNEIQLLLTDMVMPGQMTGLALSQQLLKEKPELKVIYVSGYTDEMMNAKASLGLAPNFLEKPFSAETLLRKIRASLD